MSNCCYYSDDNEKYMDDKNATTTNNMDSNLYHDDTSCWNPLDYESPLLPPLSPLPPSPITLHDDDEDVPVPPPSPILFDDEDDNNEEEQYSSSLIRKLLISVKEAKSLVSTALQIMEKVQQMLKHGNDENTSFTNDLSILDQKINQLQKDIYDLQISSNNKQYCNALYINNTCYALINYDIQKIKTIIGRKGVIKRKYENNYNITIHIPSMREQVKNAPIYVCSNMDNNSKFLSAVQIICDMLK